MREFPTLETKKHEVLNEWDKKVLEQGVTSIVKEMYKDFGNSLPDTIIFPDTSARPLLYVLDPIFRRISEDKKIPIPKYYLFTTARPQTSLSVYEKLRPEA